MRVGNIEVIDQMWLNKHVSSSDSVVGIIKGVDVVTNETKHYIGSALGVDEKFDIEFIINYGNRIDDKDRIIEFFK